ncbi:MupA/Atu3671 family FMN-dependent luciferase-like monooxygenase, partial [Streptomyces leeuwenhoekii]|uniref:MupA/Atu3671 family FMN-dependent luciferase-like monooxygenase n=1 Tax=Streptomyces leeuwenhoekii TaxID=1437453 RepID=UPI003F66A0D9
MDRSTGRQAPDFSLYFFGDYPHGDAAAAYGHLLSAAAFADEHGFHTLWLPERHFHSFGALFPNPAVLAAALATRTSRIRIHAGSVVLPLHDPIRVAEEWSVVDNLSGGRVGLGVASGWHSTDFVLAPENYGRQREVMYEHLDTVRGLWAGRAVAAKAGDGTPVEVTVHPRPVQADLPLFTAVLSNPGSYERAGRAGLGVVTNLMAQSTDDLRANIARYRAARAAAGLDPAGGRVVVLVHTYLGADAERARAEARRPFCDYLRSSVDLFDNVANSLGIDVDLRATDPEDVDFVLGRAYETYCAQRALIGSADSVRPVLDALASAGADEIGCFVDFGVAPELMLGALPELARLRAEYRAPASGRPAASAPAPGTPSAA